jgi:hypothetical protein
MLDPMPGRALVAVLAALGAASLVFSVTLVAAGGKARHVTTLVSVGVTPCCTVTPATTSLSASGSVASTPRCRGSRTIRFVYQNGATVTPVAVTATSDATGAYSATIPKPSDAAPATVTLYADVVSATRRRHGTRIRCEPTRNGQALTVSPY